MDEFLLKAVPGEIVFTMSYSNLAHCITLIISQRHDGETQVPGYKLRLVESCLIFGQGGCTGATDCLNDLSNFAISPSDEDAETETAFPFPDSRRSSVLSLTDFTLSPPCESDGDGFNFPSLESSTFPPLSAFRSDRPSECAEADASTMNHIATRLLPLRAYGLDSSSESGGDVELISPSPTAPASPASPALSASRLDPPSEGDEAHSSFDHVTPTLMTLRAFMLDPPSESEEDDLSESEHITSGLLPLRPFGLLDSSSESGGDAELRSPPSPPAPACPALSASTLDPPSESDKTNSINYDTPRLLTLRAFMLSPPSESGEDDLPSDLILQPPQLSQCGFHLHTCSGNGPPTDHPSPDRLECNWRIAATPYDEEPHASGEYLLNLLDSCDLDKGLVKEFEVMINMVKHMNWMLFKEDKVAGHCKIGPRTLRKIEVVAVQVLTYFTMFGDKFDGAILRIKELEPYLPSLGPEVNTMHLRTALNIWNVKIMRELACPQQCEKDLFDGFAVFYDAQLSQPLQQARQDSSSFYNKSHDDLRCQDYMCPEDICATRVLTERYFSPIQDRILRVCSTYNILISEMQKFGVAIRAARKRILSDVSVCVQMYHAERAFNPSARLRRALKIAESANGLGLKEEANRYCDGGRSDDKNDEDPGAAVMGDSHSFMRRGSVVEKVRDGRERSKSETAAVRPRSPVMLTKDSNSFGGA